ncbi:MAG: sigma-70 family RNA polymerase sigma factor [Acidimicrobiales bacterium]
MGLVADPPVAVAAAVPDDGFEAVVRGNLANLVRLAGVLCGDPVWAEDAVAEVFARLYRRWPLEGVVDLGAYLRRAVINEINGGFRRRARARRALDRHRAAASRPASDEEVAERDRFWRLLVALPPRQRAVLALRYLDDLSEVRVAEVLAVPVGTVKSAAARGLDRLRRLIEEEGDDAPK